MNVITSALDVLGVGRIATLRFDGAEDTEQVVFMGIVGADEDRFAEFISCDSEGKMYRWIAYRKDNGWVYGTNAGRFSVIAVK